MENQKLTITVREAAAISGLSVSYIRKTLDGHRPPLPWRVIRLPGPKGRGGIRICRRDIEDWAQGQGPAQPRRPGRPRKAEQLAREATGGAQGQEG